MNNTNKTEKPPKTPPNDDFASLLLFWHAILFYFNALSRADPFPASFFTKQQSEPLEKKRDSSLLT